MAGGIEAGHRQILGEALEGRGGRETDQLGARERRERAHAPRSTSASGNSSGRSTFIETCATPPRRATPIARRPGIPRSPPSRTAAAIVRASCTVAGGASWRLKATSGSRAATSVAPALGCSRGGPKSGRSGVAPDSLDARSLIRRRKRAKVHRGAARRGCARKRDPRRSAPRRGRPAPRAPLPMRSATTSASAHAAPLAAASR